MLDQSIAQPVSQDPNGPLDSAQDLQQGETILTILWRFKWLLGIFVAIGTSVGYWLYKQKPTTYRATTQLMFKSDTPLTLDSTTGAVSGGIPSGTVMQSLITSDAIVSRVSINPELKGIPSLQGKTDKQIAAMVRGGIQFEAITNEKDSRNRMIAALNYDGRDPQVCVAAVNAVSQAIDEHFEAERQSSVNEISKLINHAQGKLLPSLERLEADYQTFRNNAQLEWGADGQPINPHRESQFRLQNDQLELEREMQKLNSELRYAIAIKKRFSDPIMVAQIIGQFGGVTSDIGIIKEATEEESNVPDDLELQKIAVEQQLVPLEIKREQLEVSLGASHPEVKMITMQIESSQRKLNELNERLTQRLIELKAQNDAVDVTEEARKARVASAREAVDAYLLGLNERLTVMESDRKKLDTMISDAKRRADELKKAENNDEAYRRKIESNRGMLIQLEEKLAALKLVDMNGGIIVEPLLDTGQAYVTGPDLKKDLILYGMAGLGLSVLLAMLFEVSAKTFRSADEIQRELRIPVLTHIPLDEGRVQQGKNAVDTEISQLDPKLAVVHRPYSPAAESVRGVRTAMLFDRRQFNSKVFQITSPLPGDGKSTLAANVACSLAQSGKKTILIDLDLRSPRLSLRFNLEARNGLTNVLNGEMNPGQAIHQTPIENLDILPCGPLPANPAEALTLAELGDVFQWAREHYDFIIVDTPPLLMVSDRAFVTTYVEAGMRVVRIRRRCKPNSKEAVSMLRSAGARVMGVIVNKIDEVSGGASYKSSASGSYQSIGYGYGDKYRRRYQQEARVQDTYVVKGRTSVDGGLPLPSDGMEPPEGLLDEPHRKSRAAVGPTSDVKPPPQNL